MKGFTTGMYGLIAAGVIGAASAAIGATQDTPQQPAAGAGPRVLVIPFSTIHVPEAQQWIAKGAMENIVADLGRSKTYSPIAFKGQLIVEDNATAARLARTASVPLAVRGAAQMVDGNVRLTAQLVDAKSGDTVATGSVTGAVDDLLMLEDELSAQLRGEKTQKNSATTPANTAVPPAAGGTQVVPIIIQQPAPQPVAPQVIVISQPQASYPNYFPYGPYGAYGPYGYGYPYGYPIGWYSGYYPGAILTVIRGGRHHGGVGGFHVIHSGPGKGGSMPLPTGITMPLPTGAMFLPIPEGVPAPVPRNLPMPLPESLDLPLPENPPLPLPKASPVNKAALITAKMDEKDMRTIR